MQNLSHALRSLGRSPGFTLLAVLAFALGIGASATVFSVTDGVLFKSLPYHDADRLVEVGADIRSRGLTNWGVYHDEFDAWRDATLTLEDLAGHQPFGRYSLMLPAEPVDVATSRVTPNFFGVLGVSPALGPGFTDEDYRPGAPLAVLLTDAIFQELFGADPDVIGRSLTVNDELATIVGVLPRAFVFPTSRASSAPDIIVPLVRTVGTSSRLSMIGRLAPDATVDVARAELNAIAATRAGESGVRDAPFDGATVESLTTSLAARPRSIMLLLAGAVAALLLIACANVANLLLARGADRRGELALRSALGAGRASLVLLLLTESMVLAAAGGLAGSALTYVGVSAIAPLVPADLTVLETIAINSRVLLATLAVSAFTVLIAGLLPALAATQVDMKSSLERSSGRATSTKLRSRQVIVSIQVALACLLLVGGGLMANTIRRLLDVEHGYAADNVLAIRLQLPRGRTYPQASSVFVERTLEAARSVPGVVSVGATQHEPFGNTLYAGHYRVEGFPQEWMEQGARIGNGVCCTQTQRVSVGYFDVVGVPIVRGRSFTSADATGPVPVALISERLARKFPADVDPLGHYLVAGEDDSDRRLIVGIVGDVRDMALEFEPAQAIYLPLEERGATALTLVVRAEAPWSVAPAIRAAVQREAGPIVIRNLVTFNEIMMRSTGTRRLTALLLGSFGILALVLAAVGIVGIVAYSVARRTREIGLRLALGASPSDVQRQVVRESFWPVVQGLAVGVAAALGLSRYVSAQLYEVEPNDVLTYGTVSLVLMAAALTAAYLPARRVAKINPIEALRVE